MRRLGFPSHLPVKLLKILLNVLTFSKLLNPSLLILAVRHWRLLSQSIYLSSLNSFSFHCWSGTGEKALWQNLDVAYALCVLPMCLEAKGWYHCIFVPIQSEINVNTFGDIVSSISPYSLTFPELAV
jgi:hypothetical protein